MYCLEQQQDRRYVGKRCVHLKKQKKTVVTTMFYGHGALDYDIFVFAIYCEFMYSKCSIN